MYYFVFFIQHARPVFSVLTVSRNVTVKRACPVTSSTVCVGITCVTRSGRDPAVKHVSRRGGGRRKGGGGVLTII